MNHRNNFRTGFICISLTSMLFLQTLDGYAQEGGQPPGPPPAPKPNMEAIRSLKQRFEMEPTVAEVQKAALKFFRVHPERVSAFQSGASWKALMPEIDVSYNREMSDNDRRLVDVIYISNPKFKDGREFEYTDRLAHTLGFRAHWSLDRLIFNAESLDVASLVGVQEGLLREITSLYFTRRRLLTTFALNPPQDPGEQVTESIRLEEISANLDALTGGWFSAEITKRKRSHNKRSAGSSSEE